MECPSCGSQIRETAKFCVSCGKKLTQIIKDQIKQEIDSSLSEENKYSTKSPESITPPRTDTDSSNEDLSYETDDIRKIRYKKLVKEVFADRVITTDEVIKLSQAIRELELDKNEALNIQEDVAKEFGIDIGDEGDLISCGILLEINTAKSYLAGEMDNLELRLTNLSDQNFEGVTVLSYLMNQKIKEERAFGILRASQKISKSLPFSSSRSGNETVEIRLEYFDPKGKPSIYTAEFQVKVLNREEDKAGVKSISISFAAEKIVGNDLSNMAHMLEKEKKPAPDKRSSYEEYDKQWRRLPLFFAEDETNTRRNEIIINKKLKEGEDKLREGIRLKSKAEKMPKNDAIETFRKSFVLLNESKESFKKIREIDPENSIAFEKVKEIRTMISEIEGRIGILEKEPVAPPIKLSRGCLTINNLQKKFCVYSKDRITIGRDNKNDIVLRVVPYQPKDQYPENWQKSCQISGAHAEIINNAGQFYIRDLGSTNGTYLNGKKLKPSEDHLLKDDMRINIARVLDLECQFLGEFRDREVESDALSSCFTVLGEMTDSCFGVNKKGLVDAIKFRRRNNFVDEEKYIILIRSVTIGRSKSNGISIDGDKISDIHAKIIFRDNQYWIEDLNSQHGTWVNGKEVTSGSEVSLGRQSEIIIGDTKLHFEGFI